MTFPEGDQEIIKYLLHELGEDELSVMEERAANDSAFFELVASVEDELIMQYVRGDLEQGLKPRFEKAYLQSHERRARVESARQLRAAVRAVAGTRSNAVPAPFFTPVRMRLAAAVLLVVVGLGSWLVWKNGWFDENSGGGDARRELAVALAPGRLRSGTGSEAVQFVLPAGTRQVVFQLTLPEGPARTAYKAVVGTPERPGVFRGDAVVRDGTAAVAVPAELITAGDYTLELQGVDASGAVLPVAMYYFRSAR